MKTHFMASLWTVARKELVDISRDHRTLFLGLLLGPLLMPVLILGMGALAENRSKTQFEKVLEVPVVGAEHAPNLLAHLATRGIRTIAPPADLAAAIASQDVDVALRIDADFVTDWHAGRPAVVEIMHDSTRRNADIPTARLREALTTYSDQVGALRLYARGIDAAIGSPVAVASLDTASPEAKRGVLLGVMLPYFLIISAFLGGMALILDATAGERERQSLEPLLATPAPRSAIVSGKLAAACTLGMTTLLLTLLALKLSAQAGTTTAEALDVSFAAIGKMLVVLLPMVFLGNALLTYLAAAAKSTKEAQSHVSWLMLLPMLPTIMLMVNPIKTQPWQFAVPFLAQNQLLLKVIRAEAIDAQTWLIYLAAGFGLVALLWLAAVRRYHQERLAISG
jgi:sodium transport system permease protein